MLDSHSFISQKGRSQQQLEDLHKRESLRCQKKTPKFKAAKCSCLHLLLHAKIRVVTTLTFAAVGCLDWESGVAFTANHLFTLVLSSKRSEGSLNLDGTETHSSSETEHQVESGLLLDVVIRKGTAIFELLSGKDKTLLIWGNTFFILNLGLNVLNGVAGFDIQSDRLACKGLDENLHI